MQYRPFETQGKHVGRPRKFLYTGMLFVASKNKTLVQTNRWRLRKRKRLARIAGAAVLFSVWLLNGKPLCAQGNYEIQVYGSELVEKGHTMVELHSNFTFEGSKSTTDGTYPTNHQLHETIEITHGFTDWFETGFYVFTSAQNGFGWDWVGDHIRPRFSVPKKWNWPVGVSLSQEIGYQRRQFFPDTWTYELRPIVDKQIGRWYFAFNPTFDRALHGPDVNQGFVFSPNVKISYDFTSKISGGMEYYGTLGPMSGFFPIQEQEQQIYPTIDLNVSPKWEINFGVGVGLTRSTDHLITKSIIGYRFDF